MRAPDFGLHRRRRIVLDALAHLAGTVCAGEADDEVQRHVDSGRYSCGGDRVAPRPSGPVHTDHEAGRLLRELRDTER